MTASNQPQRITCPQCSGIGNRKCPLEDGKFYPCSKCGGHKWIPGTGNGFATFYKAADPKYRHNTERIMVLHRDFERPDKWRTTMFAYNGPITHYTDCTAWPVMGELKGYAEDSTAGALLDSWCLNNEWIGFETRSRQRCSGGPESAGLDVS